MDRATRSYQPSLAAMAGAVLLAQAAGPASAGEVACRFEAGVVVIPASLAGIAGDYILDTGTLRTTLHDTRANAEGLTGADVIGAVRMAGLSLSARALLIADLDVRTWNLPTPVAGVIGADVLQDLVVDLTFQPCRVRMARPGQAAAFRGTELTASWPDGRAQVQAVVSDGARQLTGPFILASGANAPIRVADDLAAVPGAGRPSELYPQGVWLARLASLTLAGRTLTDVGSGLLPAEGDTAGVIGGPVLANFRLRFDFPARRLLIAPGR